MMSSNLRMARDSKRGVDRAIVKYRFPWWLRPFLLRGVAGITLGRRIYIEGENPEAILRHELVHLRQIRRLGVIGFYWSYLKEYVLNRRRGMSSSEAYRPATTESSSSTISTHR